MRVQWIKQKVIVIQVPFKGKAQNFRYWEREKLMKGLQQQPSWL